MMVGLVTPAQVPGTTWWNRLTNPNSPAAAPAARALGAPTSAVLPSADIATAEPYSSQLLVTTSVQEVPSELYSVVSGKSCHAPLTTPNAYAFPSPGLPLSTTPGAPTI